MYLTLEMVKKHLNLEQDYLEEDEYLIQLMGAAEDSVRVHINDDLEGLARMNGGVLPSAIQAAMMLMVGNLYQNREIVGTKVQALPANYQYLIDLYRNYNR